LQPITPGLPPDEAAGRCGYPGRYRTSGGVAPLPLTSPVRTYDPAGPALFVADRRPFLQALLDGLA